MTRKDYIVLAGDLWIDRRRLAGNQDALDGFDAAVSTMCDAMKRENANFDRDKFLEAVRRNDVALRRSK